jgi:pimeloyl-ACP methyl ester carboxylesterase
MKKNRFRKTLVVFFLIILLLALFVFAEKESISITDQIRANTPGQFADLSQGQVHYELSKPTNQQVIVLVHGFSVPYYIWDPTFDYFVDNGFTVLRYDLYGRGYSDRPDVEYDLGLFIDQLHELLMYLKIDGQVHLIGLSNGGAIVSAFANRFPENVLSMTLIDPIISPVNALDIFPMNIPLVGEYITRVILIPFVLPRSQVNDFFNPERFPNWEGKYREQMQYIGFRRAILSSIRNLVDINPLTEYLAVDKKGIPILLLWGRNDQTISYDEINTFLNSIPEVEFQIIENAGHLPHYEQPDLVNPIINAFLVNIN